MIPLVTTLTPSQSSSAKASNFHLTVLKVLYVLPSSCSIDF